MWRVGSHLLAVLALAAHLARAANSIAITSPSAAMPWTLGEVGRIVWNDLRDDVPSSWTVSILNAEQSTLRGAYALASSAQLELAKGLIPCPALPSAQGYILVFTSVNDPTQVYAASEQFSIQAASNSSQTFTQAAKSASVSFLAYPSEVARPTITLALASSASSLSSSAPSSSSLARASSSSSRRCPSPAVTTPLGGVGILAVGVLSAGWFLR